MDIPPGTGVSDSARDGLEKHTERLLRWSRLISGPTSAAVAAAVSTFTATVVVFRSLSQADGGLFALFIALMEILAMVGNHGVTTLITRVYSPAGINTFDWGRDLLISLAISLTLILVGIVLSGFIYTATVPYLALLGVAALALVGVQATSHMLSAFQHYTLGSLLMRLPNALMIVIVIPASRAPESVRLSLILVGQTVLTVVVFLMSAWIVHGRLGRGQESISWRQRREGWVFLIANLTVTLPDQGMTALAGALIRPEDLATFAAAAILLRPFRLLRSIFIMVLVPELILAKSRRHAYRTLVLWAASVLAGLVTWVVGPSVIHALYAGRYDHSAGLVPIIALAGVLHLTSSLPGSYIAGRAPTAFIDRVVMTTMLWLIPGLAAGAALCVQYAALGLALGGGLLEAIRNAITHLYWARYLAIERAAS